MSEGLRQLNVNVPAGLIRECKHAAIDSDQSLSAFVAEALHRHLAGLRRGGLSNGDGERPWGHAGLVSPPSNGRAHDS